MLQELLKKETCSLHDELEQLMFVDEIMQRKLDQKQLRKLIITNYLIHQLYEDAINDQINKETAKSLDLPSRNKLNSLKLDLQSIGFDEKLLSNYTNQKLPIPNSFFAMGALYVLEGATLGGSVILKQLQLNDNFSADTNFHYYGVYGKDLIPKWQQFLSALNSIPEKSHLDALKGAKFMFNQIAEIAKKVNQTN